MWVRGPIPCKYMSGFQAGGHAALFLLAEFVCISLHSRGLYDLKSFQATRTPQARTSQQYPTSHFWILDLHPPDCIALQKGGHHQSSLLPYCMTSLLHDFLTSLLRCITKKGHYFSLLPYCMTSFLHDFLTALRYKKGPSPITLGEPVQRLEHPSYKARLLWLLRLLFVSSQPLHGLLNGLW